MIEYLYAFSLMGLETDGVNVVSVAGSGWAIDDDEANQMAIKAARDYYHTKDGYLDTSSAYDRVPDIPGRLRQ